MKSLSRHQEARNNKHVEIEKIIAPFGFVTYGFLIFTHPAVEGKFDLSASGMSPEDLMTNILRKVASIGRLRGELSVKKDLQDLLSDETVKEELERYGC